MYVCIYIHTHTHTYKAEQVSVVAALKTHFSLTEPNINPRVIYAKGNFPSCPANIKKERWCNTSFHVTNAPARSSFCTFTRNFPHRATKYTPNPNH